MSQNQDAYDFLGKTFFFGVESIFGMEQKENVKYVISCNYTAIEDDCYIVHLERKQFFINEIEPQRMVDQLADGCMKSLYPIECLVTKEGKFVDIHNYEGLRKKWQKGIVGIRERYKGVEVNAYLQQMANTLATKESATKGLLNDVVYHLLFLTIANVEGESHIHFPTAPFQQPEVFRGQVKSLPHETLFGTQFEGVNDSDEALEVIRWWYQNNLSLCKLKVKCILHNNLVTYAVTRLKEREEDSASFYIEEKEDEIEVQPKKKKKKWLLF